MAIPPEQEGPELEESGGEQEAAGGEVSLTRIQLLNLLFVAGGAGLGLLHSQQMALGVLLGGAMMALNLKIIVGVMSAVFGRGSTSIVNVGLYWVKFATMLLLVGVLVAIFQIDPIGLLIGLSIFLIAITLEATLRLVRG